MMCFFSFFFEGNKLKFLIIICIFKSYEDVFKEDCFEFDNFC